jgi:holdfast attachment protein HfaA
MKRQTTTLWSSLAVPIGSALACFLAATHVHAQSASQSAGAASMEAGYGKSGRVATETFNPVTRDANGNRLIINGAIVNSRQHSNVSYSSTSSNTLSGAAYFERGAEALSNTSTSTAVGNLITVSIVGRNNVVVLNSVQNNTGNISASAPRQ